MTYKKQIRIGTILHDRNSYKEEIMTDTDYINDNTVSYMSLEEYNKLQNNKPTLFLYFTRFMGGLRLPFFTVIPQKVRNSF